MKALLLLALLGPAPRDRAQDFYDTIIFEAPSPDTDEGRRVCEVLLKKEHWIGAYRAIEQLLGPMPENYSLLVDFTLDGAEAGWGGGNHTTGRIRFNLKVLTEAQKKADALQAKVKEAQLRGERVTYRVPPIRMDRLVYHELTHVFQRGVQAPAWFLEGMAQLVSDDPSHLASFINEGKKIQSIDDGALTGNDNYARGHLFWKWLDSSRSVKKAADLVILQRKPVKEALEEATGSSWSALLLSEREWSANEADRLQIRDAKSR